MDRQKAQYPEQFDFSRDAQAFRKSLLHQLKRDGRRLSMEDAELISAAGEPPAPPTKGQPDDRQTN